MQDKTNPFAFYAGLHLLFAFYANIVKGECRDKRELYFRFDYAEPNPIFVFTNIAKGESKDKRKSHFRLDYTESHPIFVVTNIKKVTYTTNGAPHFFLANRAVFNIYSSNYYLTPSAVFLSARSQ